MGAVIELRGCACSARLPPTVVVVVVVVVVVGASSPCVSISCAGDEAGQPDEEGGAARLVCVGGAGAGECHPCRRRSAVVGVGAVSVTRGQHGC